MGSREKEVRKTRRHVDGEVVSAFEEYHTKCKGLFPNLKGADCFIRKSIELKLV